MYEFIGNFSNDIYIWQSLGLFWVEGTRYTFDYVWVDDQLISLCLYLKPTMMVLIAFSLLVEVVI